MDENYSAEGFSAYINITGHLSGIEAVLRLIQAATGDRAKAERGDDPLTENDTLQEIVAAIHKGEGVQFENEDCEGAAFPATRQACQELGLAYALGSERREDDSAVVSFIPGKGETSTVATNLAGVASIPLPGLQAAAALGIEEVRALVRDYEEAAGEHNPDALTADPDLMRDIEHATVKELNKRLRTKRWEESHPNG